MKLQTRKRKPFLVPMPSTRSAKGKNKAVNPHEMEKMIGMHPRNRLSSLRRNVCSVENHIRLRKIRVLLGDRNAPDVADETTSNVSARNLNHAKFTGSLTYPRNPPREKATSSFSLELLWNLRNLTSMLSDSPKKFMPRC